jgi:peptide/nickel transport system substrate-binding protein
MGGTDDDGEEGETSGEPPEDNELKLINSTMSTMDPIKATDTASGVVIQQVFDSLMNYPNGEIEVEGQIADGYDISDDFTTYTINLKEGVKFHNGDEVTAQDFVYSWERLAASEHSHRAYFVLSSIGVVHETDDEGGYKPGSMAVSAEGDYTLKMELEEPFHATTEMLAYTAFAALPEGILGDVDGYDGEMDHDEFGTENPIGAGAFEFDTWESNNEARVTTFDDYHGDVANVDGIHWNISSSSDAIYQYGVVNQNADMVTNEQIPTPKYDPNKISVDETDDLGREVGTYGDTKSGATMDYVGYPTINAFYIGFNTDEVEKPVRQAAAYALNQQEALEQVFKDRGETSYHFTPPAIYPGGPDAYTEHAENNYPYGYNETKLDKAKEVMEEAGYGSDNQFEFTFTVYESSKTWPELGKLLRDKLQTAHINMEIEKAPFSTLLQRGRNGKLEAYSLGWIMDWPAPDNFLQLLNPANTDTSKDSPMSYINWSDTDASQQATDAWETIQNNPAPSDEAEQARNESYVSIEEANWEDVGFLPTHHRMDQRFKYDWVDSPRFGGAGFSRQMHNEVSLTKRDD